MPDPVIGSGTEYALPSTSSVKNKERWQHDCEKETTIYGLLQLE